MEKKRGDNMGGWALVVLIIGTLLLVWTGKAQETHIRVSGTTKILVKADSSNFYNAIRSTTFQILDSIAPPGSPPQGKVYIYSRGTLGFFVKYSNGVTHNLDSAGAGGGATDTTSLSNRIEMKADTTDQTITGYYTFTAITPANRLAYFDGSKLLLALDQPDLVEIGYMDGVTSNVQTQLNAKADVSGETFTGPIVVNPGETTIGNANTNQITFPTSGTDGSEVSGTGSIYERAGTMSLSSPSDMYFGIDNNTDLTDQGNDAFRWIRNTGGVLASADSAIMTLLDLGRLGIGAGNVSPQHILDIKRATGTDVFWVDESYGSVLQTGTGKRDSLARIITFFTREGNPVLWIIADSNRPGGIEGRLFKVGVNGNISFEGGAWIDEDIMQSGYQSYTTTTLTGAVSAGDTTITVAAVPSGFGNDRNIMIGTLGTNLDVVHVKSISGTTYTLSRSLQFAHSSGDSVYGFRWRGARYPVRGWWDPSGRLVDGASLTAAEAVNPNIQIFDKGDHVQFFNPLATLFGPMVETGGAVTATGSPSMTVNISRGQLIRASTNFQGHAMNMYLAFSAQSITHSAADNDTNRVDLVYADSLGKVRIVVGTLAVPAVVPAVPTGGTALSYDSVDAGATTVTNAKIYDARQRAVKVASEINQVMVGKSNAVQVTSGRAYVGAEGSSSFGVFEGTTGQADANGVNLTRFVGVDKNSTAADKTAGSIQVLLSGTTSNNRGGAVILAAKPDGASAQAVRLRADGLDSSVVIGGGGLTLGKGNTSRIDFIGTDGFEIAGTNSLYEASGGTILNSASNVDIVLDNNANESTNLNIKTDDASGTTVWTVSEAGSVGQNGPMTKVNNIATEGNFGVPTIVDNVSLTGQTAAISATNMTNAATAGEYVVYAYVQTTTASGSGSPTLAVTIAWTDDVGATSTAVVTAHSLSATGRSTATPLYVRIASGNITYATSISGASGSPQYRLNLQCHRVN